VSVGAGPRRLICLCGNTLSLWRSGPTLVLNRQAARVAVKCPLSGNGEIGLHGRSAMSRSSFRRWGWLMNSAASGRRAMRSCCCELPAITQGPTQCVSRDDHTEPRGCSTLILRWIHRGRHTRSSNSSTSDFIDRFGHSPKANGICGTDRHSTGNRCIGTLH